MSRIKLIVGIVAIIASAYVCAELIPPYFSNYQFEDAIKTEALQSTYTPKTEDAIRETIFKKAQDLEIPVTRDEIKVQRTGVQGTGSVIIETRYTVHVDLPGYPFDLQFNPSTKNKSVF